MSAHSRVDDFLKQQVSLKPWSAGYKKARLFMAEKTNKVLARMFLHVILETEKNIVITLGEFIENKRIDDSTPMEEVNDFLIESDFAPIIFEHSIKTISQRLSYATHGTDKEFFTSEEIDSFARVHLLVWDKNTSDNVIAEAFVDYWWETDKTCRRCSECGKLMREGYCIDAGADYYCSDDCLHKHFSDEEWSEEYNTNDQSYYTSWYS